MSEVVEDQAGEPFPGVIGRTLDDSSPAWPASIRARDGAPNVIFLIWDDVGYGQMSAFGGWCETPNVDRLADRGLRYSNIHTPALCSPTRGSSLTDSNHHTLGLLAITELSVGYPAHNGYMGFEHGFLSEILLEHGYNTFAVAKWRLAPSEETTTAGPFHRWPNNTIIVVISDNGASAEGGIHGTFNEALFFNQVEETLEDNLNHIDGWGGVDTFPHYSWGWAGAGDTPFRHWKRETYWGGVIDPCVIFWPGGVESLGEVRSQYSDVVDVALTILDALGIEAPTTTRGISESPIQGVRSADSFDDRAADPKRTSQYFEMFGQRFMYCEGWKVNCPLPGPSFAKAAEKGRYFGMSLTGELLDDLDVHDWELYNVDDDPAETKNVAEEHPEKLGEMVRRWYGEAGRYGVFPISSAELSRMNVPRLYNRPYSTTAEIVIPDDGAEGILTTHGSRHAGYALFIKDGRLHHIHNYVGLKRFAVSSADPVPTGEATFQYEFEPTGPPDFAVGRGSPGRGQLYVNDNPVASLESPYSTPNTFGVLGLICGYAAFDTVDTSVCVAPFRFTGEIKQVAIDITGELIKDDVAELNRLMSQQWSGDGSDRLAEVAGLAVEMVGA